MTTQQIQQFLNSQGYKGADGKPLTVDGVSGTNTKFAIEAYQKAKGIYGKDSMAVYSLYSNDDSTDMLTLIELSLIIAPAIPSLLYAKSLKSRNRFA